MSLPNPTVTLCSICFKVIRDERPKPEHQTEIRFDVCARCGAELAWPTNELQNRVGHPPVKADLPPSLPSSPQAAASPVSDSSLAEAAYQAFMRTPHKGLPRWEGEVPPLSSEDTHPDERRAWINAARAVRDALQAAPRDGIRIADDDGDSLTFDVHLVMTVRTMTDESGRYWVGDAKMMCGGTKRCAELDYHGTIHDWGLGVQLGTAIEAEIAARQPRKGDE